MFGTYTEDENNEWEVEIGSWMVKGTHRESGLNFSTWILKYVRNQPTSNNQPQQRTSRQVHRGPHNGLNKVKLTEAWDGTVEKLSLRKMRTKRARSVERKNMMNSQ
jgi:hypothetical protein